MLIHRDELQVGQLPPGVAAQENEAKARRRDKNKTRKSGDLVARGRQLQVAAEEKEVWEVFSEFCGRDGCISSSELRSALLQLGLPCTPE